MAMIPQDPFMFAGTVRMNIDPFAQYTDGALWDALGSVGLKTTVEADDLKLEMKIVENGNNFSLGQRQLFCMARAILQDARMLMMDEVSSLGDAESSLGDAKSSLGDAKSSLGDAKSSLGDATSSLGDAESSLGDAKSSLGVAKSSLGDV
jgi:ABC-type protease/lipase transport system fused ATPase/permease subunit